MEQVRPAMFTCGNHATSFSHLGEFPQRLLRFPGFRCSIPKA